VSHLVYESVRKLTDIRILETHSKSYLVLGGFALTFAGWWAWNAFLSIGYARSVSTYAVRGGFTITFGSDGIWWLTVLVIVAMLICIELGVKAVKRNLIVAELWHWPPWRKRSTGAEESAEEWHLELWQELEKDSLMKERLKQMNNEFGGEGEGAELLESSEVNGPVERA
jgi:phospholipid-translocating ATPase